MQIELTPEQEAIVRETLERGRYTDSNAVITAALGWMARCNEAFDAFNKTLDDAVAESDRDGWYTLDDIMAEFDADLSVAEARLAAAE